MTDNLSPLAALSGLSEDEENEAYEIGIDEGYNRAVQEIDEATGGDGEYRYCLGAEYSDRHCPDAGTMKRRIIERYDALAASPLPGKIADGGDVPTGWQLVPVEPTEAMIKALWKETLGGTILSAERAARAMLAAAPKPDTVAPPRV